MGKALGASQEACAGQTWPPPAGTSGDRCLRVSQEGLLSLSHAGKALVNRRPRTWAGGQS